MMLYVGFLTCLAAALTPALNDAARGFAGAGAFVLAIFFMTQVELDARVHRDAERKEKGLPIPRRSGES